MKSLGELLLETLVVVITKNYKEIVSDQLSELLTPICQQTDLRVKQIQSMFEGQLKQLIEQLQLIQQQISKYEKAISRIQLQNSKIKMLKQDYQRFTYSCRQQFQHFRQLILLLPQALLNNLPDSLQIIRRHDEIQLLKQELAEFNNNGIQLIIKEFQILSKQVGQLEQKINKKNDLIQSRTYQQYPQPPAQALQTSSRFYEIDFYNSKKGGLSNQRMRYMGKMIDIIKPAEIIDRFKEVRKLAGQQRYRKLF